VIVLDDFVMLGKTVPEPNSDGRIFVCSAGYSADLKKLIRVYPLAQRDAPKRWTRNRVPLERNPRDHRDASWKLAGDRTCEAHNRINAVFTQVGEMAPAVRATQLKKHFVPSIKKANEDRISLAIIHPSSIDIEFEFNPSSPDSPQLELFDAGVEKPTVGAKRFAYIPRLRFRDEDGPHRLMLRDWGCYEFMRKNGDDYACRHMGDSLHLGPDCSLLVGNLNNHPTAWLVISVLKGLREAEGLFDVA